VEGGGVGVLGGEEVGVSDVCVLGSGGGAGGVGGSVVWLCWVGDEGGRGTEKGSRVGAG